MKKMSMIAGVLFLACALAGCGRQVPELTEEENEIITEYTVDLLLKYDRNYSNRLIDLEAYREEQASLQARMEAQAAEDAAKAEAEAQAEKETEESGESGGVGDVVVNNTVVEPLMSSIEEFYGIDGIAFQYTGYDLTYLYPEEEESTAFFSMDATSGTELLVLKFMVTNISGGQKDINMLGYGMRTRINVGSDVSENTLSTMLLNDLQTYSGTLGADESTELVAIIEVPEETPIDHVTMTLRSDTNSATINLQ